MEMLSDRLVSFRHVDSVILHDGKEPMLVHVFDDGKTNKFHLSGVDNDEYKAIARWAGYGDDWRRYGIEHDLTHNWIPDELGQRWSVSIHDNVAQHLWSPYIAQEEHLVNRLQRYMMTGAADEYGVLEATFGDALPEVASRLRDCMAIVMSRAFGATVRS